MSYDIALTPMGIIASKVARDNNYGSYKKEYNLFNDYPRQIRLEFITCYLQALIKHEKERTGYY